MFAGAVSGVLVVGLVSLGAAVPGFGAAVPGSGLAVPGALVPGVWVAPGALWLGVPVWVCAGAVAEGDVLLGLVLWAASQQAESNNKAKNVALDFMAIEHLRELIFIHGSTVGVCSRQKESSRTFSAEDGTKAFRRDLLPKYLHENLKVSVSARQRR